MYDVLAKILATSTEGIQKDDKLPAEVRDYLKAQGIETPVAFWVFNESKENAALYLLDRSKFETLESTNRVRELVDVITSVTPYESDAPQVHAAIQATAAAPAYGINIGNLIKDASERLTCLDGVKVEIINDKYIKLGVSTSWSSGQHADYAK
ncbi:MAG: hypothetical protein ABIJ34_05700 [archaeon]